MHKWMKDPETGEYIRDYVYKKKYLGHKKRGPDKLPPRGLEWDKLRHRVYTRDDHTCQDCGAKPKVVFAHHIDFDRDNNKLSNLITLCRGCHWDRHNTRR